jgi:hypothetical protein
MSKISEEYEKQVNLVENVLRQQHLTGELNFRKMAIVVVAALSIKKPQNKEI